MTGTTEKQEFTFQTEIKQLLHLLSHSLYQNREITLRELISNASDALDKFRHIQLTNEQYRDDAQLLITIEPDKDQHTLTIADNGIGLTQSELVENLGTIAHSGSLDFVKNLSGDAKTDVNLIGQFGVGFYSAFMLADRVEVQTRSYLEETGWIWESEGTGNFSIEPAEGLERGTRVILHLKEDMGEFAEPERLKYIVRKYSTFVPHPIKLADEQLNEQRPIWVEPKSQLSDEQYEGFYQYLSHHAAEKPLWHMHLSSDSPLHFHTILYCPPSNFELMGFGHVEHGLHLCAKRILVQDDCRELLPEYLRFLHGIVDSDDLPLNVSRESLQDNSVFRKIRKVLVKRVLSHLKDLAANADEYTKFYQQFGVTLREGLHSDFENRDTLAQLLRFKSSHVAADKLTSLDEYIERAADGQEQIYFYCGTDAAPFESKPNLEIFRKNKLEVLYLTDPVDEIVLANLHQYQGKELISVDSADVKLPEKADDADADPEKKDEAADKVAESGFPRVLELFKSALGDSVVDVRESHRLTDSACCLINAEGTLSTHVQKVMQMTNKDFEMSKRILEINPQSPLIRRLCQLSSNPDHNDFIQDCGRQLYSGAMLVEGLAPNVEDFIGRTQQFMGELAQHRSPIIT